MRGASTMRPGLSTPSGSNAVLISRKAVTKTRAEHLFVKLGAQDAVAVFTGMRATVHPHQCECFLGDGAQFADVLVALDVEHRPHVKTADRRMCVEDAGRPVPGEDLGQLLRIGGEMFQRTAQSSMIDTGFGSPRVEVMMLSPCERTYHTAA